MRARLTKTAPAVLLLLGLWLSPAEGYGKYLNGIDGTGNSLEELSHSVEISINDGVAVFKVSRRIANTSERDERVFFGIDTLEAAITDLRIKLRGRWRDAELASAEIAEEKYQTAVVAARAPSRPRIRALMDADGLLDVYPLPAGETMTIRYSLTKHVPYLDGAYQLRYPNKTRRNLAQPSIKIISKGRVSTEADDGTDETTITFVPLSQKPITARMGRLVIEPGREYLRVEVDLRGELAKVPKNLKVVFVIDASHSIGEDKLEVQLAAARAFLAHAPDARFRIVVYRRLAEVVGDGFSPAAAFDEVVETARQEGRFELGNGSALDEGLESAERILRRQRGKRYVVAFTDGLLRPSWRNNDALEALKQGGAEIVHLALPEADSKSRWLRSDGNALSPIANAHGGILVHLRGNATDAPPMLHLIRPTGLDNFSIPALKEVPAAMIPRHLEEGTRYLFAGWLEHAPPRLTVEGDLWTRSVSETVRPTRRSDDAVTRAICTPGEDNDALKDEEIEALAAKMGVASEFTSFLVLEPGAPIPPEPDAGSGRGASGMGGRRGRAPRIKPEPYEFMSHYPDWTRLLEDGLERCRAEHPGGRDQHVDLVISLTSGSGTHEEIVDVELDGKPTGLGECLVEEAWKLEIPRLDRGERSMFWVTVR